MLEEETMRCAFVNLGKHFGGAEKYLLIILCRWQQEGNKAYAIVRRNSSFEATLKAEFPQIKVCSVDFKYKDIKRAKAYLQQNKVEVLDVNGINSGLFVNLMNVKIPRVTIVHSNAEIDRANKPAIVRCFFKKLENYNLTKSNYVIAVSESIQELLTFRKMDVAKLAVVHNGIERIDYQDRNLRTDETTVLRICFVGRLEKVKGCEYLIKALALMKDINFCCDIYGDGELRCELEELKTNLGLSDMISFKGFSNEVRSVLPYYDVMVMPSLSEAFPLTIPEAMNARVLLVCSCVGGIPYIIRDKETGYLFPAENYKILSEILREIYKNPLLQHMIVESAYREFIDKYTEDKMTSKTFEIIKKVGEQKI